MFEKQFRKMHRAPRGRLGIKKNPTEKNLESEIKKKNILKSNLKNTSRTAWYTQ